MGLLSRLERGEDRIEGADLHFRELSSPVSELLGTAMQDCGPRAWGLNFDDSRVACSGKRLASHKAWQRVLLNVIVAQSTPSSSSKRASLDSEVLSPVGDNKSGGWATGRRREVDVPPGQREA